MASARLAAVALLIGLLSLAACTPPPTPLPAFIAPTPTVPPVSPTPAPIRYALTQASLGLVPDLDAIQADAQVIELDAPVDPADLGRRYDVVAGYGARENWTVSPTVLHVALIVNRTRPPLDETAIATVMRRALAPQAIVTALGLPGVQPAALQPMSANDVRIALANAGLPDGFDVRLAAEPVPGAQAVADTLQAAHIGAILSAAAESDFGATLDASAPHLILAGWTNDAGKQVWIARAGEVNVIELYTVPISYLAVEGLQIRYAPGGFPLATR